MKTALTIAGSDPTGGAGIQADLKTMTANGVYAMTAIAALTVQNTMGVRNFIEVSPDFLQEQIDVIFEDIFPDATKTGMLASSNLIRVIYDRLSYYGAKNIVIDPVMFATSGHKLISDDAIDTLKKFLLPIATVITPNIFEAEVLSETKIKNEKDMVTASKLIFENYGCAVICKGGHSINDANDLLYDSNGEQWFLGERIDTKNTHGTGCTLSSAIASNLAKGYDMSKALSLSKDYISRALAYNLNLGNGNGPMNHAITLGGYNGK